MSIHGFAYAWKSACSRAQAYAWATWSKKA
jgi:hypothetical protein